jgi:hypothetical protein
MAVSGQWPEVVSAIRGVNFLICQDVIAGRRIRPSDIWSKARCQWHGALFARHLTARHERRAAAVCIPHDPPAVE